MTGTIAAAESALTPNATRTRWRLFVHRLGGDMVAVETPDQDAAVHALGKLLGSGQEDLDANDCCCGPEWTEYEGPLPDGTWPARPREDVLGMGPRWDGSPRARYITADQLADRH